MESQFITIPLSEYQQLVTAVQEISTLRAELESLQERFARDLAEDRQRITKLERKEPEQDSKVIDELYKEMKAQGRRQTDFATAARMTKRTKGRLHQLKAAIALDPRFIIVRSESHSQKLLIRLRTE